MLSQWKLLLIRFQFLLLQLFADTDSIYDLLPVSPRTSCNSDSVWVLTDRQRDTLSDRACCSSYTSLRGYLGFNSLNFGPTAVFYSLQQDPPASSALQFVSHCQSYRLLIKHSCVLHKKQRDFHFPFATSRHQKTQI